MKIYSYTILHSSSEDFQDRTPYLIAILENDKGERVAGIVEGYSDGVTVEINMPVTSEIEEDGTAVYKLL